MATTEEKKKLPKRLRKTRSGKKRQPTDRSFQPDVDFQAVLALPDRLAEVLRQMWHVELADWNFCMDRMRREPEKVYTTWAKSKGPGKGRRHFAAPCEELKHIQKKMLKRFLSRLWTHEMRHETSGASIKTNALAHRGRQFVYSVDLVNAFPSVKRSRVRANLQGPFRYALSMRSMKHRFAEDDIQQMLEAIVDLVTYQGKLPEGLLAQGPPTSPAVFALVCLGMDRRIFELCEESSTALQPLRVTAYSDGYHISSSEPIAEEFMEKVLGIITGPECRFIAHANGDKNRYYSPENGTVPVVTGLILTQDGRITIHPKKVNQMRGRLHALLQEEQWDDSQVGQVRGLLGFITEFYGDNPPAKLKHVVPQSFKRLAHLKLSQAKASTQA